MKKNKSTYTFIITVLFLVLPTISCNLGQPDPIKINIANNDSKTWYYRNGNVKKIMHYNLKGQPHGIYMYFDSLGNVIDSGNFFNGEWHGKRFLYESFSRRIEKIEKHFHGLYRESIIFNNGLPILYKAYSHIEDLVFIGHINSQNIIQMEGNPIYSIISDSTIDTSRKQNYELLIAQIPSTRASIVCIVRTEHNLVLKIDTLFPDYYNKIVIDLDTTNLSNKTIIISHIYNGKISNTGEILVDSATLRINLDGKMEWSLW